MEKENSVSRGKKTYLNLAIAVAIGLLVKLFVPVSNGLTDVGLNMLAILVGTIYAWITIGTGWPSLITIGLLVVGGLPAGDMLAASWGGSMIFMAVFCIMLTLCLRETGVTSVVANWFVTRRICQKRPYVFMTMFFLAGYILCMFMDAFPIIFLFVAMIDEMCLLIGYKRGDKFYIGLVLGILWIANFTIASTPISHTIPMLMMSTIEGATGATIGFAEWMKPGIPLSIVEFIVMILVIRFVLRPDVEKFKEFDLERLEVKNPEIPKEGKISLVVFLVVVAAWLIPLFGDTGLPGFLNRLGSAIPPMLGVAALCLIHVKNKPIADLGELAKLVPWDIEFFFTAILSISAYIGSDVTGVRTFLGNVLGPIVGSLPPMLVLVVILAGCAFITNLLSNAVAMVLFFYVAIVALPDINPCVLGFLLAMMANLSVLIAPSCMYSAYLFGGGYITTKETAKTNLAFMVASIIAVAAIIYPLANVLL